MTPLGQTDGGFRDSIRLRNLTAAAVTGSNAATLVAALNTFLEAAGEATLVGLWYVAEWEVLVIYAE